jgi:hypothetical protein
MKAKVIEATKIDEAKTEVRLPPRLPDAGKSQHPLGRNPSALLIIPGAKGKGGD